ncbi:MAG: DUF3078 domain-containing protein [Dysgonamonadaceae bacterium]|jgi:hypothetical protein|nr:DUF3078 domain-containing protein [Dysgonamonadaceae bacterium]
MKQKILLFIFAGYFFIVFESAAQQPDSLELFRNITDIEKQLQDSNQSFQEQSINPVPKDTAKQKQTIAVSRRNIPQFVVKNTMDSLYTRRDNGTLILPYNFNSETLQGLTFRDTMFYNPLFLPVVFEGRRLLSDTALVYPKRDVSPYRGILISPNATFAPQLNQQAFADKVADDYLKNFPDRVSISATNFPKTPQPVSDEKVLEDFNPFKELLSVESNYSLAAPSVEGVTIRRRYWIYSGDHSLQFSQNYFSENWYRGGVSNLNIYNYHILRMNYNKEKVRFNNTFEWKLSLNNAPDDTLRSYRIGEDMIRYYGDFGIDAFIKKWSYSFNLEAKSQLFSGHPTNSKETISSFLAPLYINAGVGFKYDLDKSSKTVRHRRTRVSASLAPFSINYKYVGNKNVNVLRYGIPEGKKSVSDLGSTFTGTLIYDYNRYVTWNSRLKYFTNYKKVEMEFENTLNMSLSRFFSTRLYLNLRYDDSVPRNDKFGYLQVNELVSFGLNYKW